MATTCLPGEITPVNIPKRSRGSNSNHVLTYNYLPDVVTGYPLYDCARDDSSSFYLIQPFEANNLVTNPTFYKDLDGWSAFNSKTLRTNEWAFDSGFSLRISGSGDVDTAERREYAQSEIFDFYTDDLYTFSAYLYLPQVWDVADPYSGTISIVELDSLDNEIYETFSDKIETRNKWIRLEVNRRISADTARVFIRVNLRSQDQQEIFPPYDPTGFFNRADEYLYVDMLQFERGAEATTPFHGDTQVCKSCNAGCNSTGYKWYGEPHNSASNRSACAKDGGKLVCLSDEFGFQMLSHTGHGTPPVRDISYPLANRPGEIYQKTAIDARILTFTGAVCESTLHALECAIFGLETHFFPDSCYCDGRFLIVYRHENCNERLCDPERDLALCVTYIGGLEGFRDNLFQQRLTLQFKAHDPFWFSWPGQQSQALPARNIIRSPNVVKISEDGTVTPVPIGQGLEINTAACLGSNSLVIGGSFDQLNASVCVENLAVLDCTDWCAVSGVFNGTVTTSTTDANGNVIVGGDFSGSIAIIYTDGSVGWFTGYPNGTPNALAAPFWGQIVVATDDGVYIQTNDNNWYLHGTNGPVYDVVIAPNGDIIAVGDFTEINGVTSYRIARYNLFEYDTPQWDAFDTGFDDIVRTVTVDQETGTIYVGGDFLYTVPATSDTCTTLEGTAQPSTCNSQEIQVTHVGGTIYNFDIRMGNIIARETMRNCAGFIRITASNSCGTSYNFLFGSVNATFVSAGTYVNPGGETLYTINYNVDTGYALTLGDCESSNSAFVKELADSNAFMQFMAPLELSGGIGFDDTVGSIEISCVSLTTQDTPDSDYIKHIAKIEGEVVSGLNDGVDMIPTVLAINESTRELWIGGLSDGTDDGLLIWNGLSFRPFGDIGIGNEVDVKDIQYCSDCSMVITYGGSSPVSALPSNTDIDYNGSAAEWPQLVVHGPANIESVANGSNELWAGCLIVECGEIATFDFENGNISSNFRPTLAQFGFTGSKLGLCLSPKCENDWKLYMSEVEAETSATLIWNENHLSIGALCCSDRATSPPINFYVTCCPVFEYTDGCPDDTWCKDTGHPVGSLVLDYSCVCPSLYVSIDDTCCTDDDYCYLVDDCATGLTDDDGNCLCPDEDALTTECD